eukprot:1803666-Pleurochrysis_carterae.AAC.2
MPRTGALISRLASCSFSLPSILPRASPTVLRCCLRCWQVSCALSALESRAALNQVTQQASVR